uniref:Uncharacterized protein n=1 Tax=Archaeoglobus fulgidus TaxID=2234 RepID=A0A7J3M0C1_ARCFL
MRSTVADDAIAQSEGKFAGKGQFIDISQSAFRTSSTVYPLAEIAKWAKKKTIAEIEELALKHDS